MFVIPFFVVVIFACWFACVYLPSCLVIYFFHEVFVCVSVSVIARVCLSVCIRAQYTWYFRKVYRSLQVRLPLTILKYLSIQKLPHKRSHQSIYLSNSHKKIFILCFNFIKNINTYMNNIYIYRYFLVIFHFKCT